MTKRYEVMIDGGQGGDTTIEAEDLAAALAQAIEWAKEGDWGDDGCTITIAVTNLDDEDDSTIEHVEIPSASQRLEEQLDDAGVLGESEGEYETRQVIYIDGDYYYRVANGGARGAGDRQCGDGVWRDYPCEPAKVIDRAQARAYLVDFGLDPQQVAHLTRTRS